MNHSKQWKKHESNFSENRLFLLPALNWHYFQTVWGFFSSCLPKNSFSKSFFDLLKHYKKKKKKKHWAKSKHKGKCQNVVINPFLSFHDFNGLILEIICCILMKQSAGGWHWPNARHIWEPLTPFCSWAEEKNLMSLMLMGWNKDQERSLIDLDSCQGQNRLNLELLSEFITLTKSDQDSEK